MGLSPWPDDAGEVAVALVEIRASVETATMRTGRSNRPGRCRRLPLWNVMQFHGATSDKAMRPLSAVWAG